MKAEEAPSEAGGAWEWRVAAAIFTPRRQAHAFLCGAAMPLRLAVSVLARGETNTGRLSPCACYFERRQQLQLAGAPLESILRSMPTTTSQRLTALEQQFAELQAQVLGIKPRAKDWRRTAGTFPRDKMTLAAERSGRQWRKQAPKK